MIKFEDFTIRSQEGKKQKIKILYQDEFIFAIDKPAGLRVLPDRWISTLPNLLQLLKLHNTANESEKDKKIFVVHRIDADTSGLVLFARTPEAHRCLSMAFEKGEIKKTYLAIIIGRPEITHGKIDLPIAAARNNRMKVDPQGKKSITIFNVREKFGRYSLLEVSPLTARTHQIRIHLQASGFPLAVDPLYTDIKKIHISDLKQGIHSQNDWESALISRLTLHAWRLRFQHPVTQENMEIIAEPPKDFKAILKALRKWDKYSDQSDFR